VAGSGVAKADVVIEAIFEDLEAKRALYAAAEPRMRPGALLATNTSSLTLETLNGELKNPGQFVGLHFFNPVPQMPLLEVVHSVRTSPEALAAAMAFTRRIDKLPLPCRSSPGFLVNRVLFPYLHEALHAAGEGISFNAIDRAAVDFGMPMGPMELSDVVGLDVVLHVGEIVTRELQRESPPFASRLRSLVQAGQLGRKSGQGFYRWRDGKIAREPDRQDLIDAGVIFGTGFAPFRGGPVAYAKARGVAACVARLRELEQRYGARFRADAGWSSLT
jgi:3-hydroxyacyl-CoA dehydrogenase/enoyl-CoA hydratase/3-hydroxybutyryl-CoA epimerase